jgi:hypothetical protein
MPQSEEGPQLGINALVFICFVCVIYSGHLNLLNLITSLI